MSSLNPGSGGEVLKIGGFGVLEGNSGLGGVGVTPEPWQRWQGPRRGFGGFFGGGCGFGEVLGGLEVFLRGFWRFGEVFERFLEVWRGFPWEFGVGASPEARQPRQGPKNRGFWVFFGVKFGVLSAEWGRCGVRPLGVAAKSRMFYWVLPLLKEKAINM